MSELTTARIYIYDESDLRGGDVAVYATTYDPRPSLVLPVVAGAGEVARHDVIARDLAKGGAMMLGKPEHRDLVILGVGERMYYCPTGIDVFRHGVRFASPAGETHPATPAEACEVINEELRPRL